MKKRVLFLSLVVLSVMFAGCKKGEKALIGTWISDGNPDIKIEAGTLGPMIEMFVKEYIFSFDDDFAEGGKAVFNKDKTGYISFEDDPLHFTYSTSGDKLTLNLQMSENGEEGVVPTIWEGTFKISGKKLTIAMDIMPILKNLEKMGEIPAEYSSYLNMITSAQFVLPFKRS